MDGDMVQAHAHELLNQKEASYASDTLYSATERLMAALRRLEYNLRAQAGQRARDLREIEQAEFFERENQVLKRERDTLNATLERLEKEYTDLQGTATTIDRKLSDSIKRLNNIIGE
jgi:hypothetical protein